MPRRKSSSLPPLAALLAGVLPGLLAAAAATGQPIATAPGGIIAIVGDDVITQAELDREVDIARTILRRERGGRIDQETALLERAVLERLVERKILLQLVKQEETKEKAQGPYITEAHIDAEIEQQAKTMGAPIRGAEDVYEQVREESGVSRDEFRKTVREKLSVHKYLWNKVLGGSDDFVPPQELRAFYQAHLDEFASPVQIAFRQIKVRLTRDDTADRVVQMVAEGLKKREEFIELAKRVVEVQGGDPEDALRLWDRSFEELKGWRGPVAETLRPLKKGETSERVYTGDAYCFFKVEDRKEGEPKPFGEVQEQIRKRIVNRRNQSRIEEFLGQQRKKIRVQEFLPPIAPTPPPNAQARAEKAE